MMGIVARRKSSREIYSVEGKGTWHHAHQRDYGEIMRILKQTLYKKYFAYLACEILIALL
jgi:hypothetical protein